MMVIPLSSRTPDEPESYTALATDLLVTVLVPFYSINQSIKQYLFAIKLWIYSY